MSYVDFLIYVWYTIVYYRKDFVIMDSFRVLYKVDHVLYRNTENNFCILKAKNVEIEPDQDKCLKTYIIKGVFSGIQESDTVKSICTWVNDPKYGWQLVSEFAMLQPPSNVSGIRNFLLKHVSGVGLTTINRVIAMYQSQTLEKIKESLSNLTCIPGVSPRKAELIRSQVLKNEKMEELAAYLFQNGITNYNDVVTIYDALKDDAVLKLKTNPYCICDCTSISRLPLADKLALGSGMKADNPIRIEKLVYYYLYIKAFETGNMYEYFSSIVTHIVPLLQKRNLYIDHLSKEMIEVAIKSLSGLNQIHTITNEKTGEQQVFLSSLYRIEYGIADFVKNLNTSSASCTEDDKNKFFKQYIKDTGIIPDEKQEQAVVNAYTNRLSILTGNPGTGKTQTVKAIISFIEYMKPNVSIGLCSPTGRAAQRMTELTGHSAMTIHRYLGLYGENAEIGADITDDYVIVDESSMIDAPLFYKLLLAVSRSKAALVLVGDKDQLAPVGPGLPFKEMIESGAIPTVVLNKLHRQASQSQINLNAKKVLSGVDGVTDRLLCDRAKQDFFLYPLRNASDIRTTIIRIIDSLLSLGTNISDIIVLSPMKKSALGTWELNRMIQDHVNPASANKVEVTAHNFIFRVGDKVMQIKNNYETEWTINQNNKLEKGLGVFNGDLGVIQAIDKAEEKLQIGFDDGRVAIYTFAMLSELELAYAMTVHKAQGTEIGCVIMPVHSCLVNLSRNIIYTAITRARERFIIPGDPKVLYNGINKTDNLKRNTDINFLLNK